MGGDVNESSLMNQTFTPLFHRAGGGNCLRRFCVLYRNVSSYIYRARLVCAHMQYTWNTLACIRIHAHNMIHFMAR